MKTPKEWRSWFNTTPSQPRIEDLVRAAVNEALDEAAARVEMVSNKLVADVVRAHKHEEPKT